MTVTNGARTGDHLVPRFGDLPISNSRYFTTAVVTRVRAPLQEGAAPRGSHWLPFGGPVATGEASVDMVAFTPDGRTIVGATSGGTVRRWSTATLDPIGPGA